MKDPAFLFYSDNFLSGTMFFTDEQVGKYIRLLCAQHLTGHLQEKHMIFICKDYDKDIWSKFIKDENGYFYNERLEVEILRRRSYSQSRSDNKKGKKKSNPDESKSYDNHMGNGNETGNEVKDEVKSRKRSPFKIPTIQEVRLYFSENGYSPDFGETRFHYYNDANWFDSHGNPVLNWKQKMRSVWFKPENKMNVIGKKMMP